MFPIQEVASRGGASDGIHCRRSSLSTLPLLAPILTWFRKGPGHTLGLRKEAGQVTASARPLQESGDLGDRK